MGQQGMYHSTWRELYLFVIRKRISALMKPVALPSLLIYSWNASEHRSREVNALRLTETHGLQAKQENFNLSQIGK